MATFAKLPDELLKCIADHLIRKADLLSLCLTSKRLHEAAVRCLYRDIDLRLGDGTEERVVSMLQPSNIGLKHIRTITVGALHKHSLASIVDIAHLSVRMLLEFLPSDLLEAFVWTLREPMRLSNYRLLLKKQRKLKWLQSTCLDQAVPGMDDWPAQLEKLHCVKMLNLAPHCRSSLHMCRMLMKHAGNQLSSLEITSSSGNDKFFDTASAIGMLNQEIFAEQIAKQSMDHPSMGPKLHTRIQLKRLSLQGMRLKFGAKTCVSFIDMSGLEELMLYYCPGAEALFKELCQPENLPIGLRELSITHKSSAEGECMASVDSLLCKIDKLAKLCLQFEECTSLPQASSIVRHKETLEYLIVHATAGSWSTNPSEELRFSLNDWYTICKACQALKQLSISIPPPSVSTCYTDLKDLTNPSLRALSRLSNLRTVQLTPYPTTPMRPFDADCYAHLLKLTAADTFQAHRTANPGKSLLKLISFGASDHHSTDKSADSGFIFFQARDRQTLSEASNKLHSTLPEQTTPYEAKYIADNNDILRLQLQVSKDRPPIGRENSSDEPEGWASLLT